MKKPLLTCLLLSLLAGACTGPTRITGTWKNPEAAEQAKDYNSVFIAVLSSKMDIRARLEGALAAAAAQHQVKAFKSSDYLTATFRGSKTPTKEELLQQIRGTGAQTILTVSLVDKTSETRYVPGSRAYAPMPAFGWYGGFYTYYSYWYPYMYDPGYYVTDKTYFLETNLYDANTEKLIWSAQSETVNPNGIDNFIRDYIPKLVDRMKKDGILKS